MQLGPIPAAAGGVVAEDELTAGGFERGDLSGGSLLASGDARVEDINSDSAVPPRVISALASVAPP